MSAVFALINNWTEIRVDARAMVCDFRRTPFRVAEDIGAWHKVLTSLSIVAVITNSMLVGI